MNAQPPTSAPVDEPGSPSAAGFGATVVGLPRSQSDAAVQTTHRPAQGVNLCHPGVMLRAVLLALGVPMIGAGFTVRTLGDWWLEAALGAAYTLPGVLIWLGVGCLMDRRGTRLPPAGRRALLVVWAPCCAVAVQLGWAILLQAPLPPMRLAAVAASALALSGLFVVWLHLRERLQQPVSTAARLNELQSRIRPHFLFNTMNTAIALVRVDPARAEAVLEDLSELFRAALEEGGQDSVSTLGEEIELARRYLDIEALRFGERLKVHWELSDEVSGARVPRLMLQPLLENAVRHGIEPAADGGTIAVRTRRRPTGAEITIINPLPPSPSAPGHGIALRNVQDRLFLMHDLAAEFRAGAADGVYRVDILVPL